MDLKKLARNIRELSLVGIYHAGSGHPGGCLSAADLLAVLYGSIMRYEVSNDNAVGGINRDRFILSKGHAAPALYAALVEIGVLKRDDIKTLRKIGSKLQGHPWIGCPGVETSTGSLGQGLSVAVGMAYGLKRINSPANVYVLIGDGEMQEGICWEAFMLASHLELDNLYVILDHNGFQSDLPIRKVTRLDPVDAKMRAFGFSYHMVDGHDLYDLNFTFQNLQKVKGKPKFIDAITTKGRGVDFMEARPEFYHGSVVLSKEQLDEALKCLHQ